MRSSTFSNNICIKQDDDNNNNNNNNNEVNGTHSQANRPSNNRRRTMASDNSQLQARHEHRTAALAIIDAALSIIDDDDVALSNLQRQIIHTTPDIGTGKVASAAASIAALNPSVQVTELAYTLDDDELAEMAEHASPYSNGIGLTLAL